jgi:hypothetical protein
MSTLVLSRQHIGPIIPDLPPFQVKCLHLWTSKSQALLPPQPLAVLGEFFFFYSWILETVTVTLQLRMNIHFRDIYK